MALILNELIRSLQSASLYNPDAQAAPACILWPDYDCQWQAAIPALQSQLPELLVLGEYAPDKKTGPAIWLRCMIAGHTDGISMPAEHTPILYLPGVSRQDLRAVETCPELLKPLAELQYRGVIWSQINAKDWTILAYLKSDQGGLGLDVAQDSDTKHAMQLALYRLIEEDADLLKGKRLDKDYFNTLLTGGDPIRDLLQWLNQDEGFKEVRSESEWNAFVEICKSLFAFNPQTAGILEAAAKLAEHSGPWAAVWDRYCEAPSLYSAIPNRIRQCRAPEDNMLWHMGGTQFEGWPQWNQSQEESLCKDLIGLTGLPPHEARNKIIELEKQHGDRRQLIWAKLDEAKLACILEHLHVLADTTRKSLAAGTIEDLASAYQEQGWRADDALLKTLALAGPHENEVVTNVVNHIYRPWAEDSARHLQEQITTNGYPGGTCQDHSIKYAESCILFVDGLRLDIAKRLSEKLQTAGCAVAESPIWAALPSVTGTGKPAVAPLVFNCVHEDPDTDNYEPFNQHQFKKLLEDSGWQIIRGHELIPAPIRSTSYENGAISNRIWCEFGDIDHEGHGRGSKLAKHLDNILQDLVDRILEILAAGWESIRIVSDHGWLLLPGGLPKVDLPALLAENKWGRCAVIKAGARATERLFPWYWNPNQSFALADGISCFRSGEEYAHGGVSLEECLLIQLSVTTQSPPGRSRIVAVTDIAWKGLRCTVALDGQFTGLSLDIRTLAGDAASSIVVKTSPIKDHGTASVVVENEDLINTQAMIVILDQDGSLVNQSPTIIGQR